MFYEKIYLATTNDKIIDMEEFGDYIEGKLTLLEDEGRAAFISSEIDPLDIRADQIQISTDGKEIAVSSFTEEGNIFYCFTTENITLEEQ